MTDAYPVALSKGVAQLLHSLELGTYKEADPYTPADASKTRPAIFRTGEPPLTLDNVIALRVGHPLLEGANQTTQVQIFTRIAGTVDDLDALTDRIRRALHDLKHVSIGALPIGLVTYANGYNFQPDANERVSANQTFYFRGRRP